MSAHPRLPGHIKNGFYKENITRDDQDEEWDVLIHLITSDEISNLKNLSKVPVRKCNNIPYVRSFFLFLLLESMTEDSLVTFH